MFKKSTLLVLSCFVALSTFSVYGQESKPQTNIPRLVDLGATRCIPCKKMKPILDELREEYRGRMDVIFIDVWENPNEGKKYGINSIPTQIFYDAAGNERVRHEGFLSKEDILAQWKDLGITFDAPKSETERSTPATPDTRPADKVCTMCDGSIPSRMRVKIDNKPEPIRLCSLHCYFIYRTSLRDPRGMDEKIIVTDFNTGKEIPALSAMYLVSLDDKKRPEIRAFATKESARKEREKTGGNLMDFSTLMKKELATRCGFCDRAVYPEDACPVKVSGLRTCGCCPMCALGIAARLHKNIDLQAYDALTGKMIYVKITAGKVSELEPKTAVAWSGQKKDAQGKMVSAGCFKQAVFTSEDNLKAWLKKNPSATGKMITIDEALQAKMNMTTEQIHNACKIGECKTK